MTNETRMEKLTLEEQYIKSLTEKEYKAYLIAKDHMKTLFNISKTNGFLKWKEKQKQKL